ncbi:MAG: aldo/keto reductase [Alphaproteobacteria bacterium]|nr:aldo/keto reductase [Alphaproteobacteria bacterium]
MEYRQLGKTDLRPSVLGVGCNLIANTDADHDLAEVNRTIAAAIEAGITFFDVADVYGRGRAERILGKALKGQRDRVLVATKAGVVPGGGPTLVRRIRPVARRLLRRWRPVHAAGKRMATRYAPPPRSDFGPTHIRNAIEASLRRLQTDYVDLFLLHNPRADVARQADLFGTLDRLKEQGRIRHYGASISGHDTSQDVQAFLAVPGVSVVQVLVNPMKCVDLEAIAPAAAARGIGLVARQPFHKGEIFTHKPLLDLADANPAYSPAQMAVRFGLAQPGVGLVLAGMRSRSHLQENLAALSGPPLTAEEMAALRASAEVV